MSGINLTGYPLEYMTPLDDPYFKKDYKNGGRFIYNDNLKFERVDGPHKLVVTEYVIMYKNNDMMIIFVILENKIPANYINKLMHFNAQNVVDDILNCLTQIYDNKIPVHVDKKAKIEFYDELNKVVDSDYRIKNIFDIIKVSDISRWVSNYNIEEGNTFNGEDKEYIINSRYLVKFREYYHYTGSTQPLIRYYDFGTTIPAHIYDYARKASYTCLLYVFMEHSFMKSLNIGNELRENGPISLDQVKIIELINDLTKNKVSDYELYQYFYKSITEFYLDLNRCNSKKSLNIEGANVHNKLNDLTKYITDHLIYTTQFLDVAKDVVYNGASLTYILDIMIQDVTLDNNNKYLRTFGLDICHYINSKVGDPESIRYRFALIKNNIIDINHDLELLTSLIQQLHD